MPEIDAADRQRLAFLGLDAQTGRTLAGFWTLVEPVLPDLLDGFYALMRRDPELGRQLGGQLDRLRQMQARHWERLLAGRFDADYFDSARQSGRAHAPPGLGPRFYIAGCNVLLQRLGEVAHANYRFAPGRRRAAVAAFTAAIMLDMDVSLAALLDGPQVAASEGRVKTFVQLAEGFERQAGEMASVIAQAATKLQATAGGMADGAQAAAQSGSAAAEASERTSVNVQTVAGAAEEVSASIAEIARQVEQSSRITASAVEQAKHTDTVVRALADGAQKIGDVVSLISAIAGQTNLLALNATIEAARAGAAGKGFAVVASEVKDLATQTARATGDISAQIGQIQTATREAVGAIQGINSTIAEVSDIATIIAGAVAEQGAATQEIARSVYEALVGTRGVADNIAAVRDTAAQTGHAAADVKSASGELSRQAEQMNRVVAGFLAQVKAA